MATLHRFPVLAWKDHQGAWTARLLERASPAGFDRTLALALQQLEDYLAWDYADDPWQDGLHVLWNDVVPSVQQGPGLGTAHQGQASPGREAVRILRCLAGKV